MYENRALKQLILQLSKKELSNVTPASVDFYWSLLRKKYFFLKVNFCVNHDVGWKSKLLADEITGGRLEDDSLLVQFRSAHVSTFRFLVFCL